MPTNAINSCIHCLPVLVTPLKEQEAKRLIQHLVRIFRMFVHARALLQRFWQLPVCTVVMAPVEAAAHVDPTLLLLKICILRCHEVDQEAPRERPNRSSAWKEPGGQNKRVQKFKFDYECIGCCSQEDRTLSRFVHFAGDYCFHTMRINLNGQRQQQGHHSSTRCKIPWSSK